MSDSPPNEEVILGLVLIGRDDSGGSISGGGPEVVAPEVIDPVVYVFCSSNNGQEFPQVEEEVRFSFYVNDEV